MNKYIVFLSLLGVKELPAKKECLFCKQIECKNKPLIQVKVVNDSFKLSDSFLDDYNFWVKQFIKSSVFNNKLMSVKGKKIDQFLDKNKNFGRAFCEFRSKENPEVKLSFSMVPILEFILNFDKNELIYEFFESNKDSLSEFLNKIYELRVKKWALANIESDVDLCYSDLCKIKNFSDFEELNDRIDDLFEVVSDLKQDVNALEEEMANRWNIKKSTWLNSELHSSFNFVLSFLNENSLSSLKSDCFKKEKKMNLSFFSVDINLKIYPEIKPSLSVSLSLLNLLTSCGISFEKKDSLDASLKSNFESLKNRRKIRIKIRKISKKMKKNQILKQKMSKTIDFDKENIKKKIEMKLNYVEECIEYSNELLSIFELIILYKKNNNDLMYDCKALLGEKI